MLVALLVQRLAIVVTPRHQTALFVSIIISIMEVVCVIPVRLISGVWATSTVRSVILSVRSVRGRRPDVLFVLLGTGTTPIFVQFAMDRAMDVQLQHFCVLTALTVTSTPATRMAPAIPHVCQVNLAIGIQLHVRPAQ